MILVTNLISIDRIVKQTRQNRYIFLFALVIAARVGRAIAVMIALTVRGTGLSAMSIFAVQRTLAIVINITLVAFFAQGSAVTMITVQGSFAVFIDFTRVTSMSQLRAFFLVAVQLARALIIRMTRIAQVAQLVAVTAFMTTSRYGGG
jgi:hypothetical protein